MTTVQIVENEIEKLSAAELSEFRLWFAEYDSDAWDIQIEADTVNGKLDAFAKEAIDEYKSGKVREI